METLTVQEFFDVTIVRIVSCYLYALPVGLAIRLFYQGMSSK